MEKRATVDGVVKRRAGRACALCRSRKVRCDVVRSGPPCTNCQLDSLECIVPRSKRHKVSKAGKSAVPPVASPGGGGRIAPGITSQQAGRHHQHGYHTIDTLNDMVYPSLPNFILPLPTGLDRAEMRYLYEKNAFLLPTDAFRSVCLARYLEFTHPLLPLLDKAQVVSILDSENVAKRPMALLLFHAVMCAGVTFVDDEIIKREGFESKQSARRAFFNRAKVLFDCNAESDTFVAVQTAILMSTWHPGKEKKNTWYWAGTALSLACSIGLHLEPDALRFDVPEQHLRRRVWWCAFAREQKIALALGRAPRITYYGVAMLTPKDFEEEVPDFSNSVDPLPEVMQALSALDDPSMQDALAGLCIEHMKVCVSIALFLSTIFESRKQVEGRGGYLADYGEYPPPSPSSRLEYCAQEFARWYRERPLNLRYEAHGAISSQDTIKHTRSLIVHKATVHVVYYVAVSALYRLKALSPSSTWCNKHGELQGASQRILRQSAWELTDVNWELYNAGLSPYLSTTAVGSVVAAVVVHLLDTKSQDKTVISCAFRGIQQCKQVLLSLRGTYGTEVEALGYLKAVERDLPEEQQASQVRHEVDPCCRYADQRPLDPGEEPILMRPQNAPSPTLAQIQDSCEFESPRLTEIDEIFWQSCFEEAPSCDFFRFGLPHDDQ